MKKLLINENNCLGCGLCRVYCLVEHSRTKDVLKAWKRENPRPVSRIRVETRGELSFSLQCRHCQEPSCVYSCLTGAMHKDTNTGIVSVDSNKCIGCWTCISACPSGAIARDINNQVAVKCDLCGIRDVPICVANCPNEAISMVNDDKVTQAMAT
jgi:carbon-monoxide dehydrogenase iron sulfur subunit